MVPLTLDVPDGAEVELSPVGSGEIVLVESEVLVKEVPSVEDVSESMLELVEDTVGLLVLSVLVEGA